MRILPVIDLAGNVVVHAVAGQRNAYRPIESLLAEDATATAIGSGFVKHFGASEVYVADLDAIGGDEPRWELYRALAATGLRLWLDCGLASEQRAALLQKATEHEPIISRFIIGLESVKSPQEIRSILRVLDAEQVVFSLDLRNGQICNAHDVWLEMGAEAVAATVLEMGIRSIIVLDLAQVGMGRGVGTLALCRTLRNMSCEWELIAGGGISHLENLSKLEQVGCDVALIASALHDGRLTSEQLSAAGFSFP
jgi:phosphoribosylformimino-5-aminoimidazole carboxamide ribotide isomerase